MARPLKAHLEGGTAIETQTLLLTSSERHAQPTLDESHRADEPSTSTLGQDDSINVEFERKKQRIIERSDPLVRVAAFLIAISRQNEHEGRDAAIICDSLKCGAAAGILGLDHDVLSRALVALERRGLVEPADADRFVLRDIDGLERLVDQKHEEAESSRRAEPFDLLSAQDSRWWLSELRELIWLFLSLAGLSIVCVGVGAIVALAIFE